MKNKILFITPQFKAGGGNRVFIELANHLSEENYEVEIIFPNNSTSQNTFFLNKKVLITSIGKIQKNKFGKLLNLIKTLYFVRKKRKNSIIIASDPLVSIFLFFLRNIKIYRFIQADDYKIFDDKYLLKNTLILFFYKLLTKISYKNTRIKYIFNSKYVYDQFIKNGGSKEAKFNLVHPGVNQQIFKFNNQNREELNISIMGRVHPLKGFQDFIDAYNLLDNNIKEKIKNVFIISNDNLDIFNLKNKKFKIIKPKNDYEIAKVLNKSKIFISSSWHEGFGLPQLEAMFCGNLVITSNCGGILEYAINEKNCLIYEPRNIRELKKKLEILINNKEIQNKLKENYYETIQNLTWKNTTEMFKKIIKN